MTLGRTITAMFERLTSEPYEGQASGLGEEIGASVSDVRCALDKVRTPEWIDEHGWTVPFVRRGSNMNTWRVVDAEEAANNDAMRESRHRRAHELRRSNARNRAQAALALAALNGRTREARQWRNAITVMDAVDVHLDAIIDDD